MSRRFTLSCFIVLAASSIRAEETNTLPPVVVTSARLPEERVPIEKVPANVTVIDRVQLDNTPAVSLPDLLRQQVGLVPLDTVGLGQFGNVSLRGYGERTGVLILVDGQRVNDAGDSTAPYLWNTIPLANIERVEIIRGGASTTYGEGAIGGVINIITRKPTDHPITVTATGAGGNLGYYAGHVETSGQEDFFSYFASGDRQEWTGWRDASAYRGWSALAKPTFDTAVGKFTFGYYFHDETVENPGALTNANWRTNPRQASPNQFEFNNTIHRGSLDYSKCFDDGWALLGKVYGQEFNSDSRSAYGTGRVEQPNYGATLQASWYTEPASLSNRFTFGGETIQQDFQSTFGPFVTGADNWSGSVFAQDTLTVLPELDVTAGGRFDHRDWQVLVLQPAMFGPSIREDKRANVWSYQGALTGRPADGVTLWLSGSRSFRLPSGYDIGLAGSVPGQLFLANPNIEPVDARTIEIGTRCNRSRWLAGSVDYFYSQVKNDILFNPFAGTYGQNQNFESIRQGVELTLTSQPLGWADFYYTTAFTDARFDGGTFDGNRLPLVPGWQLTGGVNLRPVKGLQVTFEVVHVRDQVPSNDLRNNFDRNQYVVLNTRASYRWRQVTAFAAVNNLLDQLYETFPAATASFTQVRGHNPAPGINFQAGATVTF